MRPSAERPIAAGEKNPDNPVLIKQIKIESIPHLIEVSYEGFKVPIFTLWASDLALRATTGQDDPTRRRDRSQGKQGCEFGVAMFQRRGLSSIFNNQLSIFISGLELSFFAIFVQTGYRPGQNRTGLTDSMGPIP
jgi:hypothetical protein